MRRTLHTTGRAATACAAALICALLTLAAVPLHIELESSSPAAGAQLHEPPTSLRLRFTAFIEPAYTSVSLTAPDGQRVPLGRVTFVEGSDREFTVSTPPLAQPGVYTVEWRTAGADGHVLEGSYAFELLPGDVAEDAASPDSAMSPAASAPGAAASGHDEHAHEGTSRSDDVLPVVARLLQFGALVALLGALSFRLLLMPRLQTEPATYQRMQRGAWRTLALAAAMLGVAIVMRLWLQSTALHGADRAWSTPLLSMMLTDTSWGRAWVLQAFLFVVLGAAIAWARPARDRVALFVATPAVIGLAAMPAISGHAAGASGSAYLAVVNDAAHVIAAGVWLGTLLLLAVVGLPALLRRRPGSALAEVPAGPAPTEAPEPAPLSAAHSIVDDSTADRAADRAAAAVQAFSPIALTAAGVVLASGLINSLLHINTLDELVATPYGRVLLVKIGLVGLVMLTGLLNWRYVTLRITAAGGVRRLRRAATAELVFATLVLIATALLTGMPRP